MVTTTLRCIGLVIGFVLLLSAVYAEPNRTREADGMTRTISLDGTWQLATDPMNVGRAEQWWARPTADSKPAPVPGIIQEVFPDYYGVVWYWKDALIPKNPNVGGRYLLRFWAVDYLADVWVNGTHVGTNESPETPFVLDATDAVKPGARNMIAVRVLNPTPAPIDDYVLWTTPHRNKSVPFVVPVTLNYGGIIEPVEVLLAPAVRIENVHIRPDWKTGKVKITATLMNAGKASAKGKVEFVATPAHCADTVGSAVVPTTFRAGQSKIEAELNVKNFRLWDLDSPNLYNLSTRAITDDGKSRDEQIENFGFRDFRVENGFFRLNGKRIFVKCTHTGNQTPVSYINAPAAKPDLLRRDLLYAKSCGFNMVRSICGTFHPWQLDLCDEIGLMAFEETSASWLFGDSPKMAERYDRLMRDMIMRDRNHPSVTIWCMLNETGDGPVFRHAVDTLPLVRSLDETRLVLLGSGRWDNQHQIGSVSNPGSDAWEHQWGHESPEFKPGTPAIQGDLHFYPNVPMSPDIKQQLRNVGKGIKPIFVSEGGIGSTNNVIREWRTFQQYQAGIDPEAPDYKWYKSMSERLIADWARYGMDSAYAFPEDFLLDSQRIHCRQRELFFDLVRSNPQICGYSVTGMLDHGITGEGLWTYWREWKPGIADTLRDGFDPVRWCTFVEPMHGYVGRPVKVEAILANEDTLKPGDYPVTAKIIGRNGVVWTKTATVTITPDGPLAIPVISEDVTLNAPAGEYTLSLSIERAAPSGGKLKFWLSDPADFAKIDGGVTVWGASDGLKSWLTSRGAKLTEFGAAPATAREVILVGNPSNASDADYTNLMARVAQGSTVIFLDPGAFKSGDNPVARLPLENKGQFSVLWDWLYHKENVAKPHAVLEGLRGKGILDFDYYGTVCGPAIFQGLDTPDDTIVAAFAAGFNAPDGTGYLSGIMDAGYRFGEGWFYVNTLRILENLDTNPVADRLLYNFVKHAQKQASPGKPLAGLPGDFTAKIREIGYTVSGG